MKIRGTGTWHFTLQLDCMRASWASSTGLGCKPLSPIIIYFLSTFHTDVFPDSSRRWGISDRPHTTMAADTPRNRKERRAQARSSGASTAKDIPLAQPHRSSAAQKTLLEIAAERQLLTHSSKEPTLTPENTSVVTTSINPDGSLSQTHESAANAAEGDEDSSTPYLDIFLYTSTLTILHFTLTLLTHHQYDSEPPKLMPLFLSSTVYSPTPFILCLLVWILHPRASNPIVQMSFAVLSIACGAWLVRATNDEPYMAVMRKAPALGTLWVWAVVESKWEVAAAGLGIVGSWSWWNGYGFS